MSDSILLWLILALGISWALGAYKRLMRLRSQRIAAFAALEALLTQQASVVRTPLAPASDPESEHAARQKDDAFALGWAELIRATAQFNASLKATHAKPLDGPTVGALRATHDAMCTSWGRLRDLPPDLAGPALPQTLHAQWEQLALQVQVARADFNRRVANYNAAIAQFPALVLARMAGFQPAQPI